jgi:hypothetical protein
MKPDDFFRQVEERRIELTFDRDTDSRSNQLSNEAMFHLPLLAVVILMLAKGQAKPKVESLGQLVGECLERTFVGFRGSAQHLGWSATLRVRTVQALSFLELSSQVKVGRDSREVSATALGHSVIHSALKGGSDLSSTLYQLERNYRNLRAEQKQKERQATL